MIFSGPYPTSGMMRNGKLYQLEIKERRICDVESSLLPTPVKHDPDRRSQYAQGGYPLMNRLINLPTPLKHTAKTNPGTPSSWDRNSDLNVDIARTIGLTKETIGKKTRLHPHFVVWMRGFPLGWTDIER